MALALERHFWLPDEVRSHHVSGNGPEGKKCSFGDVIIYQQAHLLIIPAAPKPAGLWKPRQDTTLEEHPQLHATTAGLGTKQS